MARRETLLYAALGGVVLLGLASSKRRSGSGFGGTGPTVEGIPPGNDMISYVVDPSGLILVSTVDRSVDFGAPSIPAGQRQAFRAMVDKWRPLVDQVGAEARVPSSMIFGVMWPESKGNQGVVSPPNSDGTVDAGLMQINQRNWGGRTLAQVLVPETNVKIGASVLRSAYGGFRDLVQSASIYNAGAKADGSPYTNADRPKIATRWGYAANSTIYLDNVVAASNTFLQDFALGKVS